MPFTRKFLAGLGIEADKVDAIIEAHAEVVSGLKAQIAESGDSADELAKAKAELEQAKKDLKTAQDTIKAAEKDDYKGKYETEKAAHEKLQADIAAKADAAKKEAALAAAARAAKYSDDAISVILDSKKDYAAKIEFDKDGKATNSDAILSEIAADRPGLVPKATEQHHTPANPPANPGGKKTVTWDDVDKIKDTAERQAFMAQNMESLGLSGKAIE